MASDTSIGTSSSTQPYTTVSFNMSFVSNAEAAKGLAEKRGKFNFTNVICTNVPLQSALELFKKNYEIIIHSEDPRILKVKAEQLNLKNSQELTQIRISDRDSVEKNIDLISYFFESAFPSYAPRISELVVKTFDPLTMPACEYEDTFLEMNPEDRQIYEDQLEAYHKKLTLPEALKEILSLTTTEEISLQEPKQNPQEDLSETSSIDPEEQALTAQDIQKIKEFKLSSNEIRETPGVKTPDTDLVVSLDDDLLRRSNELLDFSEEEGSSNTDSSYIDSSSTTSSTFSSFSSES